MKELKLSLGDIFWCFIWALVTTFPCYIQFRGYFAVEQANIIGLICLIIFFMIFLAIEEINKIIKHIEKSNNESQNGKVV